MIFTEALEVDLGSDDLGLVLPLFDAVMKIVLKVLYFLIPLHIQIAFETPYLGLYYVQYSLCSSRFLVLCMGNLDNSLSMSLNKKHSTKHDTLNVSKRTKEHVGGRR